MSKKRGENKKLHQRRRKARPQSEARPEHEPPARRALRLRPPPSEFDQMSVFIDEPALDLAETTLADLRALVRTLPFESAMLNLALLNLRAERVLNDPAGQWGLARWFYESWPELLSRYETVLRRSPKRPIFSPQPIAMLMRLLIDEAREQPFAPITPGDFHTLQRAVLGAHSALESSLEAMPEPTDEAKVAYEMQASAFFNRPPWLEEMTRSDGFLELMRRKELRDSKNYVPVDDWLSASGLTPEQQWALGFGVAATTKAFDKEPATPRIQAEHVEELLTRLGLSTVPRRVPIISATRAELRASFEALGCGDAALSWEFRPFKTTPFLRFANGDLLLLGMPWLLSWLGEGFHFRALTHAQKSEGSKVSGRYNTFLGEVVERYALELAHAAIDGRARVLGEQPYGKGGGKRTPDVAVVWGRDLILFEVHARRVKADVLATGAEAEALEEISKLLVVKIDQVASRIEELFASEAMLPDIEFDSIERVWPVVVSVGHLIQTQHVWNYLRTSVTAETTGTLTKARVQPLQVLDITDYERLLGIVEAGASLPGMLARKTGGPFAERDLAAWLSGDRSAPSADARLSLLKERWKAMGTKLQRTRELAQGAQDPEAEQ